MENKVGDNVPAQKKLDELLAKTRAVVEELQAFCITLQKDERPYTIKPHKGADVLAAKVHDLALRYEISVKNVPVEGMKNDLRLTQQLQPFEAVFALGTQLIADTTLQANSEYYTAFLALYGALSKAAEHDAALAVEIKDVQDAMRKVRKPRAGSGDGGNAPAGGAGGPAGG